MPAQIMPEGIEASSAPSNGSQHATALSPQRTLMRQLVRTLGDDQDAVCRAYAETERDGRIGRPRGAEDMAPDMHARVLWWEGRLKGWLRS